MFKMPVNAWHALEAARASYSAAKQTTYGDDSARRHLLHAAEQAELAAKLLREAARS